MRGAAALRRRKLHWPEQSFLPDCEHAFPCEFETCDECARDRRPPRSARSGTSAPISGRNHLSGLGSAIPATSRRPSRLAGSSRTRRSARVAGPPGCRRWSRAGTRRRTPCGCATATAPARAPGRPAGSGRLGCPGPPSLGRAWSVGSGSPTPLLTGWHLREDTCLPGLAIIANALQQRRLVVVSSSDGQAFLTAGRREALGPAGVAAGHGFG